jgi:hypothetical protein
MFLLNNFVFFDWLVNRQEDNFEIVFGGLIFLFGDNVCALLTHSNRVADQRSSSSSRLWP